MTNNGEAIKEKIRKGLPTSNYLTCDNEASRSAISYDKNFIAVGRYYISRADFRDLYDACDSLSELQTLTGIHRLACIRKFLELSGIDIMPELIEEYRAHASLNKIRLKYNISEPMISKWFKEAGFKIAKGNHRRDVDSDALRGEFRTTNSYRKVARKFGVSHNTVRRRIQSRP